jgi:hypothetical protein
MSSSHMGHIVQVGRHAQEFVSACEHALHESAQVRDKRIAMMRNVVNATSWDVTAEKMRALIEKPAHSTHRLFDGAAANKRAVTRRSSAVIIGAGPTGLSAAYHLGASSVLLEQRGKVGGWCGSIEDNGFTFDFAGHIMFSNDPYVHEMYSMLLGDNVHWQDREAWIYSNGTYTRYPFQGALYGLPPDVLKECIVGAIEARFGPLAQQQVASAGSGTSECKAESITDCCADGIAESTVRLRPAKQAGSKGPGPFANFEEFIHGVWGKGVARHFALPYNRKLWAVPLSEMETSWLGGRVPLPNLEEMIEGALRPRSEAAGTECALRLSAAWRFSGVDGWIHTATSWRVAPQRTRGKGDALETPGDASRRRNLCLRKTGIDSTLAGAGPDVRRGGTGADPYSGGCVAPRLGALRESRHRAASDSPTNTGSIIPATAFSIAYSFRAMRAPTTIRPVDSGSPARSPTRLTNHCPVMAMRSSSAALPTAFAWECSRRRTGSLPGTWSTCRMRTSSTTTRAPKTSRPFGSGCRSRDIELAGRYAEWEYYNSTMPSSRASVPPSALRWRSQRSCGRVRRSRRHGCWRLQR